MGDGFSRHTLTGPPVDIHDPLWIGEKIKMMQWNHKMWEWWSDEVILRVLDGANTTAFFFAAA